MFAPVKGFEIYQAEVHPARHFFAVLVGAVPLTAQGRITDIVDIIQVHPGGAYVVIRLEVQIVPHGGLVVVSVHTRVVAIAYQVAC